MTFFFEAAAPILGADTALTITVALVAFAAALAAAAIGALAAIYVNRRQMEFERNERVRERRLAAADDFVKAVATAILTMILNPPSESSEEGAAKVLEAGTGLVAMVKRIEILFGKDSPITSAAAKTHLELGAIPLGIDRKEQKERETKLGAIDNFLGDFTELVRAELVDFPKGTKG